MQQLIGEPPGRITPLDQTVNTLEIELMAQRRLDSLAYATIAGSDRRMFGRITFRPRMMVNTTKLDLTLDLFGGKMFAPVIGGPISEQKRFHTDGELATARGLSAAKALMVISDHSSVPLDQVAPLAKSGFWYQIFPDTAPDKLHAAVAAGCKGICLTLSNTGLDWKSIDAVRRSLNIPLILKGIMSAEEASEAVSNGVHGIVVSSYVGTQTAAMAQPMEVLPAIAERIAGRIPVLIDGSFRRGSDILMALALGARAVLIGRPLMWGLAAYGDAGVQRVMELLQSELARDMAMCGKVDLQSIDKSVVRVHKW